ncbi:exodeoxyribonuclease-3 [Brevinema andersonii]|uniref:Exodeoxyribonuclease-3 n=1 Tax=Brevinema andersonii TaxID=34097 RepID=A0A1I1E0U5_BREAD|nr:exodeoxyribonuclease III [Brevinema andersonii]SFB78858.1 exodeoxyribonuclease-3 [Brevinema andersonii]
MKKMISWNVNGIRAIAQKGFLSWLYDLDPDIVGLQEIKAEETQLEEELLNPTDRNSYWNSSRTKKGYAGTAVFSKINPVKVEYGWGQEIFDLEGRTIMLDFESFILFNIYFPNGERSPERLQYKLDFYNSFLEHAVELKKQGRSLVICGDVNTAHTEIDLARPKENQKTSGFLPIEREWIDRLLAAGFIDTFRFKHPSVRDKYSWWSYRGGARQRNVGWRIDYFFISEDLQSKLVDAFILDQVTGSDHCPIGIVLDI